MKQSQVRESEYRAEVKSLQQKVAALTTELAEKRGGKKIRQRTSTNLEYEDQLRPIGKMFSMTEDLWLEPAVFDLPNSTTLDPMSPARFVDDETYDCGTAVALYKIVPEKLHEDMANLTEFRRAVVTTLLSPYQLSNRQPI